MGGRRVTKDRVKMIKNLPPLPELSLKIINTMNDPDVSVDDVVKVISVCPTLVARLLGLANSAYFGRSVPINDLRIAIIQVLGLNLVKSLSLSLALNVALDTQACPSFDSEYYWAKAFLRAVLAQKLADRSNHELLEPNIVYTSALLLDIGMLVAIYLAPEELDKMFDLCDKDEQCLNEAIVSYLGEEHYYLGYQLLNRWHLPEIYKVSFKEFCNNDYSGLEKHLLGILRLSQRLTVPIMNDEELDLSEYQNDLTEFPWLESKFDAIVEEVVENKQEIQELASLISG